MPKKLFFYLNRILGFAQKKESRFIGALYLKTSSRISIGSIEPKLLNKEDYFLLFLFKRAKAPTVNSVIVAGSGTGS